MDYIEREAIVKLFDSECRGECVVCPHDDRGDSTLMNQIPAADVQPVVHGKWICHDDELLGLTTECSVCHVEGMLDGYYCPNCGAKMDLLN